ncbi:sensor histidine kinase [Shewanella sp. YIC-542]|uniref:sensor histidine kinase n=1 Tax=Shewanella mytili TaxID=3377111 RepID=UPI00398ED32D
MILLLVMLLWQRPSPRWMLGLLLAEVLLMNGIMAANGAASNPFNVVLLLPVVLAFMLLSAPFALSVLLLSIGAQVGQLWLLPPHDGHGSLMTSHYYGMVVGFVLAAMLVAVVVWYLRKQLAQREAAIHQLRERQLRNEQLLAIGTAAAQLTHDMATPVQSMQLLIDEVMEQHPPGPALTELNRQLQRVVAQLQNWRGIADDVREARLRRYDTQQLWRALQHLVLLARPEAHISWQSHAPERQLSADGTLLPALTNIIVNACEAAGAQSHPWVNVQSIIVDDLWQLRIENPAAGVPESLLTQLGFKLQPSEAGHGMGAVLSNATIEKFHGRVNWYRPDNRKNAPESSGDMSYKHDASGHVTIVTLVELPLEPHAENHSD